MFTRRSRALLAAFALAACVSVPASAPARGDDTPPAPPSDGAKDGAGGAKPPEPPADPVAEEKKRKEELRLRRLALALSSKRAMEVIDRFIEKDFRVWGTMRDDVVAFGPDAMPALLIGLDEIDWETRAFAASCLAMLRDKTAVGLLADAYAKEKFGEGRRQIVLAIGALEAGSAVPALVKALEDEELGVRLAAMEGLGPILPPSQIESIRRFADDPDLDMRYETRGNLMALGDQATIDKLVLEAEALVADKKLERYDSSVVEDNGDRYSQYLLGMALARGDDKRADRILSAAMTAERPWDHKDFLRMGAAIGLGKRAARTKVIHPKLASGINDKDDRVRVACTFGAGFTGSAELVPRLVKALSDNQMDVRYNAVAALGRIGGDEAAEGLRKGLNDRADEVRVGAVRALGIVKGASATKTLLHAVKDDKYMIRVLAARQLANRTTEHGVLDALRGTARDGDYGVREAGIAALGHHPVGDDVFADIVPALDDPDFGVQANACLALAKVGPSSPAVLEDDRVASRVVALLLGASQKKLARAAEEFLDSVRPSGAVPPLIEGLGHDTLEVRKRAYFNLVRITETSGPGYDPEAAKTERDAGQKRWRDWFGAGRKLPSRSDHARRAITGALVEEAKDLKWKGLDIALLFDSTGSMGGLINAAKERIDELSEELQSLLPSVRVSVYTYRDQGDDYLFYGTPLTFDTWKVQGFLQYATAGQGGDLPEAVFETVANCAQKLKWRTDAHKVIVYAGDAQHHREQEEPFMTFIKGWFTKPRQAALHALYTDTKRRSLDVKSRKKRETADITRYPVFEAYKRTAEAGRGKAVMLDDESALIKELLVLTFGDEWRADIENLLDFER